MPRIKGFRCTVGYPPNPASKTGRPYGAASAYIRREAIGWVDFDRRAFFPTLSTSQAQSAIDNLLDRGEIRRVKKGFCGCKGYPALYTFTNAVRKQEGISPIRASKL